MSVAVTAVARVGVGVAVGVAEAVGVVVGVLGDGEGGYASSAVHVGEVLGWVRVRVRVRGGSESAGWMSVDI